MDRIYLEATEFIDSDSPDVIEFARKCVGTSETAIDKSVKLFYKVRDYIRYDPYDILFKPERFKASWMLKKKVGFCIPKAILLAAAARVVGVPSRLRFADVRNHLATEKLLKLMQTDVFFFHGYTELFLNGKWLKVTPAFNLSLCEKFNVPPLEFDGKSDSIFHSFDKEGNKYMEYVRDHGHFSDLPYKKMVSIFLDGYPHLMKRRSG